MNPFKNTSFLVRLVELVKTAFMNDDNTKVGLLYKDAILHLGKDASPVDLAADDLGCAESVTNIIHKVIPEVPIITGTYNLLEHLKNSSKFKQTVFLRPGTIILCATGTGNGRIRGHTGILGEKAIIMSSDSATGLWLENFTYGSWYHKYATIGGFKVYLFIPV